MTERFDEVQRSLEMRQPTQVRGARTSTDVVAKLATDASSGGMILGIDAAGDLVVRDIFRAEPTELLAVGTIGFAKILAFRALALGAQVWVETRRFAAWESFIRTSAGASGSIQVVRTFPDTRYASSDRPILVLVDSDSSLSEEDQVGTPWTTVLTVYSQLTQWNVADLVHADLVLMQKLTGGESRLVQNRLRAGDLEETLSATSHDGFTLLANGHASNAQLVLTSVERYLIGDVARVRPAVAN